MAEQRVYFWHLKALGYCNRQMRVWCRQHEYSWRELCREGIAKDTLLSMDQSAMAQDAVRFAEESGWSRVPVAWINNGK